MCYFEKRELMVQETNLLAPFFFLSNTSYERNISDSKE